MFQDLVELGKAVAEDNDPLNLFKEDIGDAYTIGIAIEFTEDGKEFKGCHTEDFEGKKRKSVPYRKGEPGKGIDPLPVSRYSGETEKVIERMGRYLEKLSNSVKDESIKNLSETFNSFTKEIEELVDEKVKSLPKEKRAFLFITKGEKKLWELEEARRYFLDWVPSKFKEKDGTPTVRENSICTLCGRKKDVVYGNVSTITCYHLDQPGAIAGGCNPLAGVKNLPICLECAGYLNKGFDYANTHLKFFMGGLNYLLIPSSSGVDVIKEIVDILENKKAKPTLSEKILMQTVEEEGLLTDIARKFGKSDAVTLRMVFYVGAKKKWRIKAEIPRVLPSRIKKIYEAKEKSEKLPFLKQGDKSDHISVGLIRNICNLGTSGKEKFGEDNFMSYIQAIFGGGSLSYRKVLHDITAKLSREYRTGSKAADWLARHSFLFLYFLNELNVIQLPEGGNMEGENLPAQEYVSFINEHKQFFGSPGKEVAFLTGAVIGKLLEFQRKQRDSEPFRSKLGNYRFDRKKLAKLRGLLEEKLAAYERDAKSLTYTRSLRSLLDIAWAETGQDLEENDDELTLATIMGMNLSYYIGTHKNKEEKDAE